MSQPAAQRTQASRIAGIPARDIRSYFQIQWGRVQDDIFLDHIMNHLDAENRYDDMDQLLQRLNCDGFENVTNDQGENVHQIIVKKVRAKIAAMRTKAGLGNKPIREYKSASTVVDSEDSDDGAGDASANAAGTAA